MKTRREDAALSEKDQEIIAVGASVAAGCLPCTKFHRRAAAGSGATEPEILQAVSDATQVRWAATEIMARAGGLPPAEAGPPPQGSAGPRSLIRELVSASAAYAVSCSTSLAEHLAAARALGATDRQMFAAIKIACAIRDVAAQKARGAAGTALGVPEEDATACDCAEDDAPSAQGASSCAPDAQGGAGDEKCHCQTGDQRRSND